MQEMKKMPPKNNEQIESIKYFDGKGHEVNIGNGNECIFDFQEPVNDMFSKVTELSVAMPQKEAEDFINQIGFDDLEKLNQIMTQRLTLIAQSVCNTMKRLKNTVISAYPDKKAVHFALYAKKYRVRKKWSDRIIREMLKECEKE